VLVRDNDDELRPLTEFENGVELWVLLSVQLCVNDVKLVLNALYDNGRLDLVFTRDTDDVEESLEPDRVELLVIDFDCVELELLWKSCQRETGMKKLIFFGDVIYHGQG
jgi:hypothetical protein